MQFQTATQYDKRDSAAPLDGFQKNFYCFSKKLLEKMVVGDVIQNVVYSVDIYCVTFLAAHLESVLETPNGGESKKKNEAENPRNTAARNDLEEALDNTGINCGQTQKGKKYVPVGTTAKSGNPGARNPCNR